MTSLWGVQLAVARGLALTQHSSLRFASKEIAELRERPWRKHRVRAVQDQKGKTTNKGETGDTGVVTSLRIQEEKHQRGKASYTGGEKEAGDKQEPSSNEALFQRAEKGGSPPPHPQLPDQQRLLRCASRDRTHTDA